MTLEQQVVSLELAQKLKELGVKQESYFDWYQTNTITKGEQSEGTAPFVGGSMKVGWHIGDTAEATNNYISGTEMYSAFTVAELGEMLPHRIGEYDLRFWSVQFAGEHHKYCGYLVDKEDGSHFMNSRTDGMGNNVALMADTEADARANMLVYLLENKTI